MQPEPTGRVHRTGEDSYTLVLTRRLEGTPPEVWASFTDADLAAAWIGRWDGAPGPASEFEFQMLYEEGQPASQVRLTLCAPHERLRVLLADDGGSWDLEVRLRDHDGGTRLDFIQHLADPAPAEDIGPGWEYYLDRLEAARSGGPQPDFDQHYLEQGPYYAAQARDAAASPPPA
ncbi:SRPBCC domain-containing protein [Arthrobacter gandavensis]|uniref:SRPBCC domain-containing protein n=1 Tax=Arthrobacter gandavensis TaxID=169960 RepID=UPI00188E7E53|nr:SRPBCC domain-containing protein [Arthrobacter gandavensis]MBF4994783.1 SRPBCC domain-containing protein [Arthrobacter gandavensis]